MELKHGQVARIGGINLRAGDTVTLIEPSAAMPGKWYVRLRSGRIAAYMATDLEPHDQPAKEG